MNAETNCPQCGNDAVTYIERCNEYGESVWKCHVCGFVRTIDLVNNYYEDSETKSTTDHQGYGVMCVVYDESLELGYGKSRNLTSDADIESKLSLFDRLIDMGAALPEKSYFTVTTDKDVRFLRGDISTLLASYNDRKCYCGWVLTNAGNSYCTKCL